MFSLLITFRRAGFCLLTVIFAVALLGATGDVPRFNDLGHRMMCVCGCNQVLLECNHVGCQYSDGMRQQLLAKVQKDSSDDSVLQSFVQEYGTTVLAAPTSQGFDKLAWIMPFAVFFAGSFTAAAVIRNWKSRAPVGRAGTHDSYGLDKFRDQARKETEL
jgi:cytochrome c-type biogenesis protein CcmH/NrfF